MSTATGQGKKAKKGTPKPAKKVAAKKGAKKADSKPADEPKLEPKAEQTANTETKKAEPVTPANFLSFVGGNFYTKEAFIKEAEQLGISRRMPSHHLPADLISGESRVYVAAGGQRVAGTDDPVSEVFGFFIPGRVEFITGGNGKMYADIISALGLRPDSKIIDTIEGEPERGCGFRKEGGTYLVVDKADSPLQLLDKPVKYIGNHFRGLMRLTGEETNAIYIGKDIAHMVDESCMNCGSAMKCAPDGHARADRERRRIDKGEQPKWKLLCTNCGKEDRKTKLAAKKGTTAETPAQTTTEAVVANDIANGAAPALASNQTVREVIEAEKQEAAKPEPKAKPTKAAKPTKPAPLPPAEESGKVAAESVAAAAKETNGTKPACRLIGGDGNVFAVIGAVTRALKKANMKDKATEFSAKAMASNSYDAVLALAQEYVEVE